MVRNNVNEGTERLFPLYAVDTQGVVRIKAPGLPVWTASKARLIERYLRLFVYITRHGTYIDGFAGPQVPDIEEYAAKLVVESKPARLRHFHLFDVGTTQRQALHRLQQKHPERDINVYHQDFNRAVDKILTPRILGPKEATFCLLDQRTFECHWSTVCRLAAHKSSGYKIELFYFLANWWSDRAIAGLKDDEQLRLWWGRGDWQQVPAMRRRERVEAFRRRFSQELGYRYVMEWPIYEHHEQTNRIMYYMIHATDHPEAPKLMARAYAKAVRHTPHKQLTLDINWEW
jgi:three-Cys-motif partner protein